jgi:hypothetical protein
MRKMKRMLAATLALTFLFATNVMAQTPREILTQAYANSADATAMSMTGNMAGTIYMMGTELLQLNVNFLIDIDMDLDAGTMMMYMRMPMTITGMDPITQTPLDESTEIAMFMDGNRVLVYERGLGWFTDPSMDMADVDIFAGMDLDELMAWALEINEQIMDEITIQFADDNDQFEGYYVIEQIMDWDDLLNMMGAFLTPELFEDMIAFVPEEELAALDPEELELVMAELDGLMDMLTTLLEDVEVELEMVYRSYIDVETLTFSTYTMNMALDFAVEVDLGIAMTEISGNFTMNMDVDYNPTFDWPVIDTYLTLDDLLEELMAELLVVVKVFDEDMLEERVAYMIDNGFTAAMLELMVEYDASFNIFIVNHGDEDIAILIDDLGVDVTLAPDSFFVMQAPADSLDGGVLVLIDGVGVPLNVETGFRLTNYPLS